jgi:hypothetical protein
MRVRDRQKEMARVARDVIRIKAEVMAEHFSPETFAAMAGVQLLTAQQKALLQFQASALQRQQAAPPPQMLQALAMPTWEDVMALMRDDAKRAFRIDIETDSTIEPNEQEEKAQTVELIQALSSMVQSWGPAIEKAPQLGPMVAELIKFGVRRFRAGRELETVIEQTMAQIASGGIGQAPAPQGPPQPPPDQTPVQVANLNLQRETVKQQGEDRRAMLDAQIAQGEQALRQRDQQMKAVAFPRDPNPQVTA